MVSVLSYVKNNVMDRMETKIHKQRMIILKKKYLKSNHPIHKQIVELLPLWNESSQLFQTKPKVHKDPYANKFIHCSTKRP